MVASKFKLIFFIILLLQLSAILSKENDHNNNKGMSMNLHTRSSFQGMSVEPLYRPNDLIEYYIKLSVGTPPQDLLLLVDTGTNVVWAPCTPKYTCTNCVGYNTVFSPSNSSSALPVQCADPKCEDICGPDGICGGTNIGPGCSGTCPNYWIFNIYGSRNTTGQLLTDTLSLPTTNFNLGFGCSVASFGVAGIAGFGRGNLSLPSQLSALIGDKFAYCLSDQNNNNRSSMIVLGDTAVPTNAPLKYTSFLNNPQYNEFYYIGLQGVSIGGKSLTLTSYMFTFDSAGNGGTIIDSGTSFTTLPPDVYDQIASEFASQIGYPRAPEVEAMTNFGLCYNVLSATNGKIRFPEFLFIFNGGSHMVLPQDNYFAAVNSSDTYCLMFYSAPIRRGGPIAFLGNYQLRNFYILYDREMNRLGFTQQGC